jgi:hypothetical protein
MVVKFSKINTAASSEKILEKVFEYYVALPIVNHN